jgi:hypothetical protein
MRLDCRRLFSAVRKVFEATVKNRGIYLHSAPRLATITLRSRVGQLAGSHRMAPITGEGGIGAVVSLVADTFGTSFPFQLCHTPRMCRPSHIRYAADDAGGIVG